MRRKFTPQAKLFGQGNQYKRLRNLGVSQFMFYVKLQPGLGENSWFVLGYKYRVSKGAEIQNSGR